MQLTRYKNTTLSTELLIKRAQDFGIKVKSVYGLLNFFKLSYKGHEVYLRDQIFSVTSDTTRYVARNKNVAKIFMAKAGIAVPKGGTFLLKDKQPIVALAKKIKFPVVAKPLDSTHGELVFMDIKNEGQLRKDLGKIAKKYQSAIVEKQFSGKEYRILATPKKVLGIIHRVPANVTGDGQHTIAQLIKIKNSDPRRGEDHKSSLLRIKVDAQIKEHLKQQKLSLSSVPKKGKTIFLRTNSNLSTGGDSLDFTEKVHPSVKKIAIKAIQSIPGLPYAGIDFISHDITKKQTKKTYVIIELNESPMLSMHHFPFEGKERDVAGEIIKDIFPEVRKKK